MMPGQDFDLVTLSIDPDEGPEVARTKKAAYLEDFGHPEVADHWRFLTGSEEQILRLTESVGWRFRYLVDNGQYDHPPVLVFLSPRGYSTRYLNAFTMSSTTLRRAVVEASEGRVGSFIERVLLSCLTFDPNTGAYTVTAMTVMRIGGVVTVIALAVMIFTLRRRERTRVALATT
jgi:protein SCO1/2